MSTRKLLVSPSSRAIREYISSQKDDTLLPKLLEINSFFKYFLVLDIGFSYIDKNERFLYLKEITQKTDLAKLGIIPSFAIFLRQSKYIFALFDELSAEQVDIKKLAQFDIYSYYQEHISILENIYKNYLQTLEDRKKIDKINLAKHYKINEKLLQEYKQIQIIFEGYFTNLEFEILSQVAKYIDIFINFDFNKYNEKSIQKFISYGLDLELGYSYEINFSKKEVLKKELLESKNISTTICSFSSRLNQIAFAKKSIETFINLGLEPSKIALILPDESFSSYLKLFDSEGYFNYAMGFDILNSKLYLIQEAIHRYLSMPNEAKNIEFLYLLCPLEKLDFLKGFAKNITKENFFEYIEFIKSFEKNEKLLLDFENIAYDFSAMIFSNDIKIATKDLVKLLLDLTKKLTKDDIQGGKITVLGALETRSLSFDALIILDFNEDFVPRRSIKDKFLSSALKKSISLPSPKDRENLQKYYYYKIISSSKYVNISYVQNAKMQKSRLLDEFYPNIKITENADFLYSQIICQDIGQTKIQKEIKQDFKLRDFIFSASSLKIFLECKRHFYYKYIAKIKPHDISALPKAYELGSIIHKLLEQAFSDFESLEKSKEYFFAKLYTLNQENEYLDFDLKSWASKMEDFFINEKSRFQKNTKNNIEILDLEKHFHTKIEGINFSGIIDRIDFEDNIYKLIDYKTSKSLKISSIKNYDKSLDFQLEIYALALQDSNQIHQNFEIKAYYYSLENAELLEETTLIEKIDILKSILREFKNEVISFELCEDTKICEYCDYKNICSR